MIATKIIEALQKNAHVILSRGPAPLFAIRVSSAKKRDQSVGACARYFSAALESAGFDIAKRPRSAAEYGPFLLSLGFELCDWTPANGIVLVWPRAVNIASEHGHVEMQISAGNEPKEYLSDLARPAKTGVNPWKMGLKYTGLRPHFYRLAR